MNSMTEVAYRYPNVVGIDLGTSSVKVLQRFCGGQTRKVTEKYLQPLPQGWGQAVIRALFQLDLSQTVAIGLTSQVGTYVVDGQTVISWSDAVGTAEIQEVLAMAKGEEWEREIGMRHPRIVSYPLPRLLYIRRHMLGAQEICQPKDWLLRELTGAYASDPFSWRGLANAPYPKYSSRMLAKTGFTEENLPPLVPADSQAGETRRICAGAGEIPAGIPVYVGLNDFFSSLLGMGAAPGVLFDITGTSEHLGDIEEDYRSDSEMVSSPWIEGYAHYGVTASSGVSLAFSARIDPTLYHCSGPDEAEKMLEAFIRGKPPVFLPYLNGERAPIWNADARGVFFGISADCNRRDLAYAVMEGVCFSLLHIYETLGQSPVDVIRVSGGASVNPLLNRLKAEMFSLPVETLEEEDTTAMGATLIAMAGAGWYETPLEAARAECRPAGWTAPDGRFLPVLLSRFSIYKRLYPAIAEMMMEWRK